MTRSTILLTCAAIVLAGCVAPSPEAPTATTAAVPSTAMLTLEDDAGDAHEWSPEGIARFALCDPLCPPIVTAAAAPYFDILGVSLEEQPEMLVFKMDIARLAEGFPELDAAFAPMHRVARYEICFAPSTDAPVRCPGADVYVQDGALVVFGNLAIADDSCNEWATCMYEIDAVLTPGEPAQVRLDVPKAFLKRADGPTIAWMAASAGWSAYHPVWPWWHAALTLHNPTLGHQHKHLVPADYTEKADTLPAQDIDLVWAPATAPFVPVAGPEMTLGPGNSIGKGSQFDEPQLDLLDVDLSEEAGQLVVTMRFADLPEDPGHDIQHILMFGVEGEDMYEVGWLHVGDRSYGYAGHCISFECEGEHEDGILAEHDTTGHSAVDTEAEVVTGPMGTITIRAPFTAFPTIGAGDVTNFLWVVTQWSDFGEWQGSYDANDHRDAHKMSFIDLRFGGEPYTFVEGNAEPEGAHEH